MRFAGPMNAHTLMRQWLGPSFVGGPEADGKAQETILVTGTGMAEACRRLEQIRAALSLQDRQGFRIRPGDFSSHRFGPGYFAQLHIEYGSGAVRRRAYTQIMAELRTERDRHLGDGASTEGVTGQYWTQQLTTNSIKPEEWLKSERILSIRGPG